VTASSVVRKHSGPGVGWQGARHRPV